MSLKYLRVRRGGAASWIGSGARVRASGIRVSGRQRKLLLIFFTITSMVGSGFRVPGAGAAGWGGVVDRREEPGLGFRV